jgi:hypothetical protein
MTLPEQGAKVATGAIDALRSQPLLLGVLLLNLLIFVIIFYAVQTNRAAQHEIAKLLIEQNAKAADLLSRCVVPPRVNLPVPAVPLKYWLPHPTQHQEKSQ